MAGSIILDLLTISVEDKWAWCYCLVEFVGWRIFSIKWGSMFMILTTRLTAFTRWEHFKIFCDKLAWIISLIHQDSFIHVPINLLPRASKFKSDKNKTRPTRSLDQLFCRTSRPPKNSEQSQSNTNILKLNHQMRKLKERKGGRSRYTYTYSIGGVGGAQGLTPWRVSPLYWATRTITEVIHYAQLPQAGLLELGEKCLFGMIKVVGQGRW